MYRGKRISHKIFMSDDRNTNESGDNMRREKRKSNHYRLFGVAIISMVLTACGAQGEKQDIEDAEVVDYAQRPSESYNCSVQELNSYLLNYETDYSYVSADITINGYSVDSADEDYWNWDLSMTTGAAEVTWQFYDSLEQMESALAAESDNAASDAEIRMLYYTFPLPEDVRALDIYHTLNERYGTEDQPFWAIGGTNGTVYSYVQETRGEDGNTYLYPHSSAVNLFIKDKSAYGLVSKSIPDTYSDKEMNLIFWDYENSLGGNAYSGWGLSEERLYWIDHEERVTSMAEPNRSFLEIRGIDENWESAGYEGIMTYFGMLKEADYEVPLTEDGSMLNIHFTFAEEPSEEGYRYYLWNGHCMDEDYHMTVTNQETGKVLQESTIQLSIELPDTITFIDLNADGYADMRIDKPSHSSGERAVMESWSSRTYMLWNPQEEQFERKTEKEVQNSLLANQNGLTEEEQDEKTKRERLDKFAPLTQLPEGADPDDYIELTGEGNTEYVVQPGDCLWSISERLLGSGFYWRTLQREENATEDPDYLLPGEIIRMPEKIYIPRDPYSRGGLRSEGSFQIEQPDGFQYYFLAEDVLFNQWSDENTINCLPITNKMGENALSEDWEAFKDEVIRCSEEICPGKVSNLQFEKYFVKGGCDLYGYSFEYDAGDKIIEYTDFIRLSSANMVEVIGVREKEPNTVLLNTTRYIAASFIDYGGEPTMGWGGEVGPNVGADDWNYPFLHNLFTAAKEQFDS